MMGRRVADHFEKLEKGLNAVAEEIKAFRQDVKNDLESHSRQLQDMRSTQQNHGDRLTALEKREEMQ